MTAIDQLWTSFFIFSQVEVMIAEYFKMTERRSIDQAYHEIESSTVTSCVMSCKNERRCICSAFTSSGSCLHFDKLPKKDKDGIPFTYFQAVPDREIDMILRLYFVVNGQL